eukprot:2598447-Pyramimonas_sp.AAC.1
MNVLFEGRQQRAVGLRRPSRRDASAHACEMQAPMPLRVARPRGAPRTAPTRPPRRACAGRSTQSEQTSRLATR